MQLFRSLDQPASVLSVSHKAVACNTESVSGNTMNDRCVVFQICSAHCE